VTHKDVVVVVIVVVVVVVVVVALVVCRGPVYPHVTMKNRIIKIDILVVPTATKFKKLRKCIYSVTVLHVSCYYIRISVFGC
jgi:hypothetical protein